LKNEYYNRNQCHSRKQTNQGNAFFCKLVHYSDADSKRIDFLLLDNNWGHWCIDGHPLLIPMRHNLPLPQEV
jgi:hypothetical protein